jgi:anti-anti-sigma regulatory factor
MLRIQRSSKRGVVFSLSGRIETEDVVELQRLLSLEAVGQDITLDLQDITLVDRDAVKFLASCEAEGVKLENCPAYVREWIGTDSGGSSQQKR